MPRDFSQFGACLNEVDRELFRLADRGDCKRFHKDTQFTAVLLLFVRCASLLRPVLTMFESRQSDGFQAVLRAFEETWNLAHDLRLVEQNERAALWLAGKGNSWKADMKKIKKFSLARGLPEPMMERVYRRLSLVAHPTRAATENSGTLCGVRLGFKEAEAELVEEYENEELSIPDGLYRLVWLMLDQDTKFIPMHAEQKNLPLSWKFIDGDNRLEPTVGNF